MSIIDIGMSKYDGKVIRLNIILTQNLLMKIDLYVETHREYGSRCGFLAHLYRKSSKSNQNYLLE
ncbi:MULTISPECIES: type II toxin-antitoxin system HicB family antitoxin [Pectobacterium]|uniref:type II toxin-antitoxin system HicB family antitoxin n=1 Tax=Pectobacterium TaxID=122277 RepID=UPI0032F0539D